MRRTKEEARAIQLGFDIGLFDLADLVAWADALLLEVDVPPSELLDISLAPSREVAEWPLAQLARDAEEDAAFRMCLAAMAARATAGRLTWERAAKFFYALYLDHGRWDCEEFTEVNYVDDAYELSRQGLVDKELAELDEDVRSVFRKFADDRCWWAA